MFIHMPFLYPSWLYIFWQPNLGQIFVQQKNYVGFPQKSIFSYQITASSKNDLFHFCAKMGALLSPFIYFLCHLHFHSGFKMWNRCPAGGVVVIQWHWTVRGLSALCDIKMGCFNAHNCGASKDKQRGENFGGKFPDIVGIGRSIN